MSSFTLYVDNDLAALDSAVTGIYLTEPIRNPYIRNAKEIEGFIDKLEEQGILQYEHRFVPVREVNRLGTRYASHPAVERVIPSLILKTRVTPLSIYRSPECGPSFYYKAEEVKQHSDFWLPKWINRLKRLHATKINYKWLTPYDYNWERNSGAMDRDHALALLKHGRTALHYNEGLTEVPRYWLKELEKTNLEFCMGRNYLARPPMWWTQLYGVGFDYYLSSSEKESMLRFAGCLIKGRKRFNYITDKYKPVCRKQI